MEFIQISDENRQKINEFIKKQWYTTVMVVRGKEYDMAKADGIYAVDGQQNIIGLITYVFYNGICEIVSLDSLKEKHGIGTSLLKRAINEAKVKGCRKVVLITTNDNMNAMQFYQKRGFDMAHFYHNAVNEARKIKLEIPLVGDNGIPLKHEIEFEYKLTDI